MKYDIAMLWVEGPLSWMEQLSLVSFRDLGCKVVLYHYGDLQNVPEGIELRDGREIHDGDILKSIYHDRYALFSDFFRCLLLKSREDVIWVDIDVYALKELPVHDGYLFALGKERNFSHGDNLYVMNGILKLPPKSRTLNALLEFMENPHPVPPWTRGSYRAWLQIRERLGIPVHVTGQKRSVWGPHALTWFLKETGEISYALPRETFYPEEPVFYATQPLQEPFSIFTEKVHAVHFGGSDLRLMLAEAGGYPHPQSFLGHVVRRHGIDMQAAPLPSPPTKFHKTLHFMRKKLRV